MRALKDSPWTERFLGLMERKDHFAWHLLASGKLTKDQLRIHFQQEYLAYVRDFPVLMARVMGSGPPSDVRRALAENIYEEQTGKLSGEAPHPDLFLVLMEGLGLGAQEFHSAQPLPTTSAYRAYLDAASGDGDWRIGYAVMCVFVEGSAKERSALGLAPPVSLPPATAEEAVSAHPLVKHYGVDRKYARLTRAHFAVEGAHRSDAWTLLLPRLDDGASGERVEKALRTALDLWHVYRDGVATAMGVTRQP